MTYDSKNCHQIKKCWTAVLICAVTLCPSANSFSPGDPGLDKYATNIGMQVKKNWVASDSLTKEVIVSFEIVDDGTIYNPRFVKQSGNSQLDGECLSAVCLSSPLEPLPAPNRTGRTLSLEVSFKPSEKPAQVVSELRKFREGLNLSADYFVSFKCPTAVLIRYPGLLSEKELFASSNFRRTNTAEAVYTSHQWSNFVRQHQKAKKEEILKAFN